MKTTNLLLAAIVAVSLAACSSTATNEAETATETEAVPATTIETEPLEGASTDSTAVVEETATEAEVAH